MSAIFAETAKPRFTIATVYPRLIQLGSLAIPTAGVLTAIAILAALFTARTTARRFDLNPEKLWDLGVIGILTALFAPRLILIFTHWQDFLAHPLWMIGVAHVRSQPAVLGGIATAILAAALFALFTRMPIRRTLDAFAPPLALGFTIASIGAFTAGANFGTPTNLPWAVTYTSRLASLWSGTPLGTPLHPVQIYAAIAELCILALLLAMIANQNAWKIHNGQIMATWLSLHGTSSFFLNFLRADLTAGDFLLIECVSAGLVLAATPLLLRAATPLATPTASLEN